MSVLRLAQLSVVLLGLLTCLNVFSEQTTPDTVCPDGSAAQTVAKADFKEFVGRPIAGIVHHTIPVFDPNDPREDNALYRLLNAIHVETRDGVIAGQLLFTVGDTIDVDRLAETERILRARHYLNNAEVTVVGECGAAGVVLLVEVRDVWTLEPEVSLGREGGENNHGFGFSEENFLGTGNSLFIGYDKDADRSSIDYGFYSPHLFNTRISAALAFADTSDGQQTIFSLTRPFYSLETPWSAGMNNADLSFVDTIRYHDEDINAYKHEHESHSIFFGAALKVSTANTQRVILGLEQDKQVFTVNEDTLQPIPENFNDVFPFIEYRFIANEFAVYTNLNQLHQVEDVSVGADLRVRVGHGGEYFGNEDEFSKFTLVYSDLVGIGEHHLMKFKVALDSKNVIHDSVRSEAKWGGSVGYFYLAGEKHRWYASASYDQGHQLQQHNELTAGGRGGLRGYPLDYQRGEKRYLVTIEKRYISDIHLFNLFRFGTAMYLDMGRAWGGGYSEASHLANVGVGLRMSSSKAKLGKVLHLDFAVPLVERDQVSSFQWVITASQSL